MTERTSIVAAILGASLLTLTLDAHSVEKLSFDSFTPDDYAEIISGAYRGKPAGLHGFLEHPKPGSRLPAVVIVPGSGGYAEWMQATVAKPLNDAGIATLIVDSFTGRGVRETATDQGRVPMAASVMDAFQALALLAQRADIDPTRIGVTGFSRGGTVSMFTAEQRLMKAALPKGPHFAAHLPFYPGCSTQWLSPQPGHAPIRFLLGAEDRYTPAQLCIDYAARLRDRGATADHRVYEGAHHAWMADYALNFGKSIQTFGDCDLKIEDDGGIRDMKSGATTREGWKAFATKVVQSCAGRGALVGADPAARAAATADMIAFFRATLLP